MRPTRARWEVSHRFRPDVFALAAYVPLIWLLAFAGLLVAIRVSLGHWPRPYAPDPYLFGGSFVVLLRGTMPLVYFPALAYHAVVGIALIIPASRRTLTNAGLKRWHLVVGYAAMSLWIVLVYGDQAHWLMSWFAD